MDKVRTRKREETCARRENINQNNVRKDLMKPPTQNGTPPVYEKVPKFWLYHLSSIDKTLVHSLSMY